MVEEFNLLKEQKWAGEFYPANRRDERFFGSLDYAPEHGIVLTYSIVGQHETRVDCTDLHGVLDDGSPCLLIGDFSSTLGGLSGQGGTITHSGQAGFRFLILGPRRESNDPVRRIRVEFTGQQEFFVSQVKKMVIPHPAETIRAKTDFGHIEISASAECTPLNPEHYQGQIYSSNAKALETLRDAVKDIRERHGPLFIKHDLKYHVVLTFDGDGTGIQDAYNQVEKLAALFALLRLTPTHPQVLTIEQDDSSKVWALYTSLSLNRGTIERCARHQYNFHLPLTADDIDLVNVIPAWMNRSSRFDVLTSGIQFEVGFRTFHTVHGDIVLYVAQLEQIAKPTSGYKDRFLATLERYAEFGLQENLKRVFAKAGAVDDLGVCLSDLRNEIVHLHKPKKILLALTLGDLIIVAASLQLVVAGYALEEIGIQKDKRERYQMVLAPHRMS